MRTALLDALSSPYIPASLISLCKQEKLDRDGLSTLIEFILQDSETSSELASTKQTLARALLLEPYPFDNSQIQALARLLSDERLINLIFELLPPNNEDTTAEQLKVHNTVEELTAVLVIRTSRVETYQRIVSGNHKLANLLMKKRLETLADPKDQQALISELLDKYQNYDWQEESFTTLVQSKLLPVFLKLPEKEFKDFFKRFYNQHAKEHAAASTKLISELLERMPSAVTWMQSCLLQDNLIQQDPNLIIFFLKFKDLRQPFLVKLLQTINNHDLLKLLLFFVEFNENNQHAPDVFAQILDCFCLRLFNASGVDKDPIHEWQTRENAPLIALHLASRPNCLQSLSNFATYVQSYTPTVLQNTVLQGFQSYFTKSSPAFDLKNRGIAVIGSLDCTAEKLKKIALETLSQFRNTPQILQAIFTNLELANTSLKKLEQNNHQRFQDNYQRLKVACWELLVREQPYDEKAATQLLTTQLTIANCFDWMLITLINESKDTNSPVYLSQIDNKSLCFLEPATLAAVLLQSNTKETTGNWLKVEEFLKNNLLKDQIAFAKALIQQLILQDQDNVPTVTVEQSFKLITRLPSFANLIVALDFSELQWVVTNSPELYIKENFSNWLDSLLNKQKFDAVKGCELFTLLPAENLESLLANEKLTPYLPKLFLQFAKKEIYSAHQVELFKRANLLNDSEKQALIATVQQSLLGALETQCALPVLTALLLSLNTLSINDTKAKELIRNQLKLFNQIAHNAEFSPDQSVELQQSVFNLLNFLNTHDSLWIDDILNDANFASIAPLWLKNIDATKQNYHPFTQLLLGHTAAKINSNLLDNPDYQKYLQQLLSNRPKSMTDDQFNLLFKQQLSLVNQKSLAQELLQKLTFDQLSDSARITLSRVLTIQELYDVAIDKQDQIPEYFVELLTLHPDGLNQLSEAKRNILLSNLKNHQQLLHILDSQTSPKDKANFVNHIFEYLLQNKIIISDWLDKLRVDGPCWAALANYTINPTHQELLNDTIKSTTWPALLREDIKDYLQQPTLNSPIESNGLLYLLIKDTFLNPQTGWRCHSSLLPIIKDSKTVQQFILRNQFLFLGEVLKLQDLYEPFINCNSNLKAPLIAARWLHLLPLLSHGLLQIVQDFPKIKSEQTKDDLKKTRLYAQLIKPILSSELSDNFQDDNIQSITIQLNELYDFLAEYAAAIEKYDQPYSDYLYRVIQQYKIKLQAIEHASFPGAHDLFHPYSPTAPEKHRASPHNLNEHSQLLNQASCLHSQHMDKTLSPSDYMTSLLNLLTQNPRCLKGSHEFQTWLFTCLISPLTASMSPAALADIFTHYHTHSLIELINTNNNKLNYFHSSLGQLKQLNTVTSLEDMLKILLTTDLDLLLEVCEFADLHYLSNLIHFALQIKKTELPNAQLMTHLLPFQLTENYELEWIKGDLAKLDETNDRLIERHNMLILAAFNYNKSTKALNDSTTPRITQLPQLSSITTNLKTITDCLNSYLPIFKTNDTNLIDQFLNTMISLIRISHRPDSLISQLRSDLLDEIMGAALKSPEQYKLFIAQLMDASEITRYLVRIQTQLTALIGQYKPKPHVENLTLADLSADEISKTSPEDFQRILFLQRLLLQISPPLDLSSWVNDDSISIKDKKIRAYFAADAEIYEQIIKLSEQTAATNLEEQDVKSYQINVQNAYSFIAHDHYDSIYYDVIYGQLGEKFKPTKPINPCILYHYLNLASIFDKDHPIFTNDRLNLSKLLESTNLPLDVLERLRKNCPSKVIFSIYSANLLSRHDFFATLPGKPMLDELKPDSYQRIKKRLYSLIQPIDLTLTPEKTLQLLDPEAAATLFCSAPHFPQLNETNIPILLERVGEQRDLLLSYWINAYSEMPNYEGALLKLTGLYPEEVAAIIGKMPLTQRQNVLSALLIKFEQQEEQEQTFKENQLTTLSDLINNYLHECEADSCLESERLELKAITHQLVYGKIKPDNQQVLLNQFWKSLQQSNGRIIAYSLQHKTKNFIRALSLQKKPGELVKLFNSALPHLTGIEQKKTKGIVEKARAEAKFEDSLSKLSFLKTFRSWWRRCFFYGFFADKQPKYLASLDHHKHKNTQEITQSNFEKLTALLNTTKPDATDSEAKELFDVLSSYEHEPKNQDEEIAIRIKIEQLFSQELAKSPHSSWLPNHIQALITNRKQLIAIYCASGQREALLNLLTAAKHGPGQFDDIIEELLGSQDDPFVEAAIELGQTIADYATSIPYLAKIPEGLNAITGHLRRVPDQLGAVGAAISEQVQKMPEQLGAITGQLRRVPDQLGAAISEQVQRIPNQVLRMPGEFVSFVGGHFNFFASTSTASNLPVNRSDNQHSAREPTLAVTANL